MLAQLAWELLSTKSPHALNAGPHCRTWHCEQQPATSLLETGRQSGCQRLSLPPVHLPCRVIVCREITGGVRISVGVSIMKALVVLGSITHPGKVEQ